MIAAEKRSSDGSFPTCRTLHRPCGTATRKMFGQSWVETISMHNIPGGSTVIFDNRGDSACDEGTVPSWYIALETVVAVVVRGRLDGDNSRAWVPTFLRRTLSLLRLLHGILALYVSVTPPPLLCLPPCPPQSPLPAHGGTSPDPPVPRTSAMPTATKKLPRVRPSPSRRANSIPSRLPLASSPKGSRRLWQSKIRLSLSFHMYPMQPLPLHLLPRLQTDRRPSQSRLRALGLTL